jgi:DNA-binding IclR family transcriptional regulator
LHGKLDLRAIALPEMKRLRDSFGESVNLSSCEGDRLVYVEWIAPNHMMHAQRVVGSRTPLHITAVGELNLAGPVSRPARFTPDAQIRQPIRTTPSPRFRGCLKNHPVPWKTVMRWIMEKSKPQ